MNLTKVEVGKGTFNRCTSYFLSGLENFDIKQIALSGQAFRFMDWGGWPIAKSIDADNIFCISAFGEYCELYQNEDGVELVCTGDLYKWLEYFDIIDWRDGSEVVVYKGLGNWIRQSQDEPLKEALRHSSGIRILHQDFLETGISFITSCANNIPRIQKLISRLCKAYGNFIQKSIENYEVSYWTFPSLEALQKVTEEDLRKLGFGFRAPSIINFIQYYASLPDGYIPLPHELQTVGGIGPKVADCISLYSFHDLDRVPMDVWMKRFQDQMYGGKLPWDEFSPYRGICQQYLYYYYRDKELGKK